MEEQALQTVELLQRDNQLLRQELKGLRQQGAPQQQQQQHTCATCTACAEDHSQNRQQLEDDLERLRQGIERVNEQARLQQEQQLEAEAVEGENCRLRLHLARVMEEARAAQRRCSALLATTTAQGKAIAALKQDNKQLRQAQSTVLQQEETAAVGQGALDKQGGGVRLTDRGTKRLREASVQQRDHPGAAGQDVGIVQTLAPDMESECLKRELARVREEAGAKQRQDMAMNMAVIAAQGRKIAALQQDNERLRLGGACTVVRLSALGKRAPCSSSSSSSSSSRRVQRLVRLLQRSRALGFGSWRVAMRASGKRPRRHCRSGKVPFSAWAANQPHHGWTPCGFAVSGSCKSW